ncbi:LysR family transcriptional regulator [Acidithiobacillus sp. CV18-2]|uniref:LysR family transcriptional regulator n=1 Tax=Igneacidithiobacillus copahuensis TaxID=2724909 RepID=A0AAE2YSK5_9PROT|nr:LysR family transcriptional regulator [Igneacidithiobacillus copahuensis]MBU2754159.1 LysR family transcriptional regulator [Acidithiobacillus sp. CV18-3]MBU2758098.1 LysR family transcriptional regulator [Acidithiobacillus sp. BN09-2]MBU2777694.1 LysR family transcriptional regulator [Acidithiobacillus sp. CV18-2]MBU2796796.1 LysR family transcriptional regulator [Acidithiobacillus sp. VAN18-2]MBU2799251.1 LysR family transcriptional regulator [Acidithiobacillus sp. VAN18-4]
MNHLDQSLLKTWVIVAETLNLKAAAIQLHVTQSAVSHQLKRLQDWLGEPLYYRTTHGISPTPIGRHLLRIGKEINRLVDDAQALRDKTKTLLRGSLMIYASQTNAEMLLPRILGQFMRQYPDIRVSVLTMNSRQAWQRREEADVIFIENSEEVVEIPVNWVSSLLLNSRIVLLVPSSHPFAASSCRIPVAALVNENLLWREEGSGIREHVMHAMHAQGLFPSVHYQLSGMSAIRDAIHEGIGLGFVSAIVSVRQKEEKLVMREIDPVIQHTLSMLYRKHTSFALEAFLDCTRMIMGLMECAE